MKIVIAIHHVAQNDQKMHWIKQPRRISLWRSMNLWASSFADSAGDGGGMKCIMNPCATIIATISAMPDHTAALARPESSSICFAMCLHSQLPDDK
jgi:hypothetical protein